MTNLENTVITHVVNVITVSSPKGRYEKIHNRRYYGLSFCTEGQLTYTQNGKDYISDPGHAVIMPMGASYTIYQNKTGSFPVINFTCLEPLCDTITVIPIENNGTYIKEYEQLEKLLMFGRKNTKIMSIFYNILHELCSERPFVSGALAPAMSYLENNYSSSGITNELLARECNISEVYFRKLFAESYGMTPRQFIIEIRINKAKQLLTEGTLKISAVAEKCGFTNQYHFTRVFKSRVGLTPSEYMKQSRDE